MAISCKCPCGRTLRVKDDFAGRRVRCPNCSSILTIPEPETEYVAGDVVFAETPGDVEKEPESKESEVPAPPTVVDRPLIRAPRLAKKRRSSSKRKRERQSWGLPIVLEQHVIGGLLMIVIAIVWFVAGLIWLKRIYFYPPILLIIGIGTVIWGFMGDD